MKAQINRWLVRVVTVFATMILVSCATPAVAPYIPNQNAVKTMSVGNARRIVENGLPNLRLDSPGDFFSKTISSARVASSGITILLENGRSVMIPLKDVSIKAHPSAIIMIVSDDRIILYYSNNSRKKDIADALFVLTQSGPKLRRMEDIELHFDATAQAYRDATPKPALPEAARRFRVQAEGAINDKDFNAAADLYLQALSIAPWWPQVHFDRALVLSETGDFPEAIAEMKRYIALVPDAPDARAAQDKIYDWERKAGTSN